jgi:hypothetical protein
MLRILGDVSLPLHAPGTGLDARTALGGVAAGVATTLLAALVPPARADLEPPLEAMPLGNLARSGAGRRVQLALALAPLARGVAGFALRGLVPAPVRTFGPLSRAPCRISDPRPRMGLVPGGWPVLRGRANHPRKA